MNHNLINNNQNIYQNAWEKCVNFPQKKLEKEFKKDNCKLFFQALQYLQENKSVLNKNIRLTAKVISCIPEQHVKIPSVYKILSYLQTSRYFLKLARQPFISFCIEKGKSSLVFVLLDHGFPPTNEMLFESCKKGLFSVAQRLIEKGVDVNCVDKNGGTPLLFACANGFPEMALMLIEKGANVNCVDKYKNTPFQLACSNKLTEVALKLIEKGANVNCKDVDGNTPLHLACSNELTEVALKWMEKGADVKCKNYAGMTPLHCVGDPEIAFKLFEKGVASSCVADSNASLFLACKIGLSKIVLKLIKKGANVNCVDKDGNTPLMTACYEENMEVALLLIENGANVNCENKNKETPLIEACNACESYDVVLKLIESGANVNVENDEGESPLGIASYLCSEEDGRKLAFLLVDKGANVNGVDHLGTTYFENACKNNCQKLALKMIENGLCVANEDENGKTYLHIACESEYELTEVALALIDKGAEINCVDRNGNTPFYLACYNKHPLLALKLLEKGADVFVDCNGVTSLGLFCQYKLYDVILAILKKGKKWNLNDPNQRLTSECLGTCLEKELMSYFEGDSFSYHALLARALLFGDEKLAHDIHSNLTPIEKIDALKVLERLFESNSLHAYFDNLYWEINPNHYFEGKDFVEKLPPPLHDKDCVALLEQELVLQNEFPQSTEIHNMLSKIKNRERIQGLGEESDEKVEQWYIKFSLYLIHVLDSYKFGQKEGDSEEKTKILECLAAMEEQCSDRWMEEIKQFYKIRPHKEEEGELEEEFSVEDKGHRLNRNLRKDIVMTKLLKFELGNVHEPHFLLNLLNGPLNLRVEKIRDLFANYEDDHLLDDAMATFKKYYTPTALIDNLTGYLQSLQAQEKTSRDPLDLTIRDVLDWLKVRVAPFWKQKEYQELPFTVKRMLKEEKTPGHIMSFLSQYGIEWEAGETFPEAMQRLSQEEISLSSQINQLETMLATSPDNRALQDRINNFVKKRESYKLLEAQVSSFSLDAQKRQFLEEKGFIKKPQPLEEVLTLDVLKKAQIDTFFNREVFHKDKFTRSAAIHLLVSWGVLHPGSLENLDASD
jgi:uncharacterized protein